MPQIVWDPPQYPFGGTVLYDIKRPDPPSQGTFGTGDFPDPNTIGEITGKVEIAVRSSGRIAVARFERIVNFPFSVQDPDITAGFVAATVSLSYLTNGIMSAGSGLGRFVANGQQEILTSRVVAGYSVHSEILCINDNAQIYIFESTDFKSLNSPDTFGVRAAGGLGGTTLPPPTRENPNYSETDMKTIRLEIGKSYVLIMGLTLWATGFADHAVQITDEAIGRSDIDSLIPFNTTVTLI